MWVSRGSAESSVRAGSAKPTRVPPPGASVKKTVPPCCGDGVGDDRQAEPRPRQLAGGRRPPEPLERVVLVGVGEPAAGVVDGDLSGRAGSPRSGRRRTSGRCRAGSVRRAPAPPGHRARRTARSAGRSGGPDRGAGPARRHAAPPGRARPRRARAPARRGPAHPARRSARSARRPGRARPARPGAAAGGSSGWPRSSERISHSTLVRRLVSGVRSSWLESAISWRCRRREPASRSIIELNADDSRATSSRPRTSIGTSRSSVAATCSAAAVSRSTGRTTTRATASPAPPATSTPSDATSRSRRVRSLRVASTSSRERLTRTA